MLVMRKWKLHRGSGSKKSQQNFTKQRYMLSFEGRTLLVRETLTMLISRDVIHRGSASFLCMIHVLVSVIIPVLKKKSITLWLSLVFLLPLVNIVSLIIFSLLDDFFFIIFILKCFRFKRNMLIVLCISFDKIIIILYFWLVLGHVTDLKDVIISQISLGKAHAVTLTNKGLVYTFGINNKGQCGRDYSPGATKEGKFILEPCQLLFHNSSFNASCQQGLESSSRYVRKLFILRIVTCSYCYL